MKDSPVKPQSRPTSALKVWITAIRPYSFTASGLSVLLGLAVSYHLGHPIRWGLFALTALGVFSLQAAANLLNDYFDFRHGIDRDPLPVSGALVRGWLTEREVLAGALGLLAAGIACGLVLTWLCGPVVLVMGLIGTAITVTYTLPKFCLKYYALGDLAVLINFGFMSVFGTFWVQAHSFSWLPLLWSVPLNCYTVAILHANNWRDIERDQAVGCRSVAGLLHDAGSRLYYKGLVLGPYALVAAIALSKYLGGPVLAPPPVMLVLLSLPLAVKLARIDSRGGDAKFSHLDGLTAQLQLVFGLLLVAGCFVAGSIEGTSIP